MRVLLALGTVLQCLRTLCCQQMRQRAYLRRVGQGVPRSRE